MHSELLQLIDVESPSAPSLEGECRRLDRLCRKALLAEAMAWPKPGLVTPIDSGSHHDMDIDTFLCSIAALEGSFFELALASVRNGGFALLAQIGREAEQRMLHATGGVNTHRGAIFNLGLLVAAAMRRAQDHELRSLTCGEIVARLWGTDILESRRRAPVTHGNEVYVRFAAGGAREQAAGGFAAVYACGLPALRLLVQQGHARDRILIGTLMHLMEHVDDTNLLWRAGEAGLRHVQHSARAFNLGGGVNAVDWRERLVAMGKDFVRRNLSPGGSADLLAASWLAWQLDDTHDIRLQPASS